MKKILISIFLFTSFLVSNQKIEAYDDCSEYGFMAIGTGLGSCKCMSGYTFGKDFLGKTSCVSVDQMCKDKLGYGARYNILYDTCECGYGDIIRNGKCTNADNYCSSEYGYYSSYNTSSKKCECDSGYTLDSSLQCVKKQNNVYFTLKELDTDNKKAIIKSDYDYSYYSIEYNSGCYASSFKRYLNHQIVVNLGTDFYLDTWDKIVLQDDDETCDVVRKEKVDSSFSLEPEEVEEDIIYYTPQSIKSNTIPTNKLVATIKSKPIVNKVNIESKKETKITEIVKTDVSKEVISQVSPEPVKKIKWYKKIFNWFK